MKPKGLVSSKEAETKRAGLSSKEVSKEPSWRNHDLKMKLELKKGKITQIDISLKIDGQ